MTHTIELIAYAGATLLTGLVAGVFLAFSDFVMRSLSAATPVAGIEAMQLINRKVYASVFLVWLLGMAPVSAALAAYAWFAIDGPAADWFIAGGTIYVIGTFLVTMLGNVPMNRRLDGMTTAGAETQIYWQTYATYWTMWNHVRTVSSALASGCFLVGCVLYA
ncbi:hypothetical protein PEL8287_01982 [Roseovarius litorisediminis]|uniref:DUF1772 domain-containing protein n=1 Tax=Roseovarius litorisediminis TaxID=1312363 RepID=A0A1Y5SGI2_9RHOB|nr:anthrone oxygenase family protein [Roseovarius litorisediminis]SLN40165.1 hypothetical protein PEL8287_01982 [Roseovarius litorisediminis]